MVESEGDRMGEFELLARIRERLPAPGPRLAVGSGDDAAVSVPDGATATSVDAVVDGVHFRRGQAAPRQIGVKALGSALSDLAAMGAEPGEAYLVIGIPPDLAGEQCLELLDGILEVAGEEIAIAGGDIVRSPVLILSVTVVGHASSPADLVTRSGARAGDALVLTGRIGAAAAGLALLERDGAAPIDPELAGALVRRQLEPAPRLGAGLALAAAGATAMIDLSDGLGADAAHLAEASGVGLSIEGRSLPVAAGVAEVAALEGRDPLELAAAGGEDYELLAAIPEEGLDLAALEAAAGVGLTRIGAVAAGEGVEIRLPGGRTLGPRGHDQLG